MGSHSHSFSEDEFLEDDSDSSSVESSSVKLPDLCVVCGCVLSADNRSERATNICEECMRSLEF